MSRLIINNFNEFAQHIGQELGVSDYLTITQEQIDLFEVSPLASCVCAVRGDLPVPGTNSTPRCSTFT